jgi:TonB family protein
MRLRFLLPALALAPLLAAYAGSEDFEPQQSHAPPPPPQSSLPATRPAPRPKQVSGKQPDYPALARRFNVHGPAKVIVSVQPDGRVAQVQPGGGVPVLDQAAMRAVKKWRFETRPSASEFTIALQFGVDGEYPFDTAVRPMLHAPAEASELKSPPVVGFGYLRLLIAARGKIIDQLPCGSYPEEFAATANEIAALLTFAPAPQADTLKGKATVNEFLIDYAADGKIRVKQRKG